MHSVRRAINTIESLKGKFNGDSFENAMTCLRSEDGLSSENIESLVSIITNEKHLRCTGGGFRDILFCCIPRDTLSSDVLDIPILWMLSENKNEFVTAAKINAVLDWIIGLLEFNLIDRKHVDDYYELYYGILQREPCQMRACHLIHMLTRPADVYRGRVEKILHIHRTNGSKTRFTAHLIELFKTFKPELVPENVKTYSREAAFKSLSPGFRRSLEAASQRAQLESNPPKNSRLEWTSYSSVKNKSKMPLIPSAMYVHLGSELYREKSRKVIDFLDKESLASYHLHCEIPTSILSLLLNEGGMHFLATHNSDVHARFSSVLYSCLYSVFMLRNKNVPYEERERFLEQLVLLEDYMQQGIPVVSRFLALYIASWNGVDHQQHIYRLLERITLASFAEFNDCILTHLQTLFISGDIKEKQLIIKTLSSLIFNIFVIWKKQNPKEHLFLGEKYNWEMDFNTTVPQLIQVVTYFCELGLSLTSNEPSILHVSLSFFESLVVFQADAKLELTVLPPSIFYRCLFSLDFCSLARACSLLLRYKEVTESLGYNAANGNEQVTLLNNYSCDVWNCLVNKKAFTKSRQGHILKKHDHIKQILTCEPDAAFSIEFHPTMIGLAQHAIALAATADTLISQKVLGDVLVISFPELGRCLSALANTYSQYHGGSQESTE